MTKIPTVLIEEDSNRVAIHLWNVSERPVQIKVTSVSHEEEIYNGVKLELKAYGVDQLMEIMPGKKLLIGGLFGSSRVYVEAGRASDVEYVLHSTY